MPPPGGTADKLGNLYESIWVVDQLLEILQDRFESMVLESADEDGLGVEFYLIEQNDRKHFHSVKRQSTGSGWSLANLVRKAKSTGRSILSDLFVKLRNEPSSQICFVSATGANDLRELSERADRATDRTDFVEHLNEHLSGGYQKRIVETACSNNDAFAFLAMKNLRVVLTDHIELQRRVEQTIHLLFYSTVPSGLFPAHCRTGLYEYALSRLGQHITKENLLEHLRSQQIGLKDWKLDEQTTNIVAKLNDRYRSNIRSGLRYIEFIERGQVRTISEMLTSRPSKDFIIVAAAGYGKSCVVDQVIDRMFAANILCLCVRLDTTENCQSAHSVGQQLDLPRSPAITLAGIADGKSCLLVIDQLDALSVVSGRNQNLWDAFDEIRREAAIYPNMSILLACRDYDLEQDSRIRTIVSQPSFEVVEIGKLTAEEVKAALQSMNVDPRKLTPQSLELLRVPLHLNLFSEVHSNFRNITDLFNAFWQRNQREFDQVSIHRRTWSDVMDRFATLISNRQALSIPQACVDDYAIEADTLLSKGVLLLEQNRYRFFHESFFDYAFARAFCRTSQGLHDFLVQGEQHLFRRSQVRQILTYRRENDRSQYLSDIKTTLDSDQIRFHIKRMIVSGFHIIEEPEEDDWNLLRPYLFDCPLSRYAQGAIFNHVGWFTLLDRLGLLMIWLSAGCQGERDDDDPDDFRDTAIWLLHGTAIHDHCSGRVAELITPYMHRGASWQNRLLRIIGRGNAYKSEAMAELFLEMIRLGFYDDLVKENQQATDMWTCLSKADKKNPRFVIQVLAAYLDRRLCFYQDGSIERIFGAYGDDYSHSGSLLIHNVAISEPAYFVEEILPKVFTIVQITAYTDLELNSLRNRTWPSLTNSVDHHTISDSTLYSLCMSLKGLACKDANLFRQYVDTLIDIPSETIGYLLLTAWTSNPQEFAEECAQYMSGDLWRLRIGYSCCFQDTEDAHGTGESAISRTALKAITPHCSDISLSRIENAILDADDIYERVMPEWRERVELLLLQCIDEDRRSARSKLRFEELLSKYPDAEFRIVGKVGGLARVVTSPIKHDAAELMTDDDWIAAMRKYDGSSEELLSGGVREFCQVVRDFAGAKPHRFAQLTQQMPDDLASSYFTAVLDGMCYRLVSPQVGEVNEENRTTLDEVSTETFCSVINRLHELPGRPCGSAIAYCFRILKDRDWPETMLEVLSYYAINDPDPIEDKWKSGGFDGPLSHGINTIRGQAAEAISHLLFSKLERVSLFWKVLEQLAVDRTLSVRACAFEALLPLHNSTEHRDQAVTLFLQGCEHHAPLIGAHSFEGFVQYAKYHSYSRLKELLQFGTTQHNDAARNAVRQIALAELSGIEGSQADAAPLRKGRAEVRRVLASVYAEHIDHGDVGEISRSYLEEFFDDEDEEVRQQVCRAFWKLTEVSLLKQENFVKAFVCSRSFLDDPTPLLCSLEESKAKLPEVICEAGERMMKHASEKGDIANNQGSVDSYELSKLVIRQYEQARNEMLRVRCLDLIDRLEQMAAGGIVEALAGVDR